MRQNFMEYWNIQPLITPVDLSGGANAGDWASLKNYSRAIVIVQKGIGTDDDDPVLALLQATAVAGTGSKPLQVSKVWSKLAVDITTLGVFTKNTQDAGDTYTEADSAQKAGVMVMEILPEDLDVANGFDCISLSIADVGDNAQIGGALVLLEAKFPQATPPSPIVD